MRPVTPLSFGQHRVRSLGLGGRGQLLGSIGGDPFVKLSSAHALEPSLALSCALQTSRGAPWGSSAGASVGPRRSQRSVLSRPTSPRSLRPQSFSALGARGVRPVAGHLFPRWRPRGPPRWSATPGPWRRRLGRGVWGGPFRRTHHADVERGSPNLYCGPCGGPPASLSRGRRRSGCAGARTSLTAARSGTPLFLRALHIEALVHARPTSARTLIRDTRCRAALR